MSAPTTDRATPTATAEYDATRRAQARAAGQPIERMTAPGIFGSMRVGSRVDLAMVWTDESGTLVYHCPTETKTPRRVTVNDLDRALALPPKDPNLPDAKHPDLEHPRRLVVPDHATLRRLMARAHVQASSAGPEDYTPGAVYRRLQVASRLAASTRLVVLTRALARKFWIGSQFDPDDFGAWRRAFRFGNGATVQSVMTTMVGLAEEGRVHNAWATEAFAAESYALTSAAFPGLRSAVGAFRRVETADTAVRAIFAADPMLRERNLLDGTVSALRVLDVKDKHFTASVSTPFKIRAGKSVLLLPAEDAEPGTWAETMLQGVSVATVGGDDQLVAKVARPSTRHRSDGGRARVTTAKAVVDAAVAPGGTRALHITEAPFLPFGGSDAAASRWTASPAVRADADKAAGRSKRDIPLDVIVAGAPTT